MKEKRRLWIPLLFVSAFALTRIPGVLPENFSAAYGLAFCAGVFLAGPIGWWLPLGIMLLTDVVLNVGVYNVPPVTLFQLFNYGALALIILLGRSFRPRDSLVRLLGGGLVGAIIFYVVTNTGAWLFNPFRNPEYTRDLGGWLIALTKGTGGYPETWTFFRNTLLSGGLFAGMMSAAVRWLEPAEAAEPAADGAESPSPDAEDSQPEEARS